MRILVYGSSYLTELAVNHIQLTSQYDLVGYVPSVNPTVSGKVNLPCVKPNEIKHDIKLCLQYDRKIKDYKNCFNIHTGLLPQYGGCDILWWTLKNKATQQGLTCHLMAKEFDAGPFIAQASYPVLPGDTVIDLYMKMTLLFPSFTLYCLDLIKQYGLEYLSFCPSYPPTLYKRGNIPEEDKEKYQLTKNLLQQTFLGYA